MKKVIEFIRESSRFQRLTELLFYIILFECNETLHVSMWRVIVLMNADPFTGKDTRAKRAGQIFFHLLPLSHFPLAACRTPSLRTSQHTSCHSRLSQTSLRAFFSSQASPLQVYTEGIPPVASRTPNPRGSGTYIGQIESTGSLFLQIPDIKLN
jgi:hypothetical protein